MFRASLLHHINSLFPKLLYTDFHRSFTPVWHASCIFPYMTGSIARRGQLNVGKIRQRESCEECRENGEHRGTGIRIVDRIKQGGMLYEDSSIT
jgi:hypothetical protein